jgi:hypothetical protein
MSAAVADRTPFYAWLMQFRPRASVDTHSWTYKLVQCSDARDGPQYFDVTR